MRKKGFILIPIIIFGFLIIFGYFVYISVRPGNNSKVTPKQFNYSDSNTTSIQTEPSPTSDHTQTPGTYKYNDIQFEYPTNWTYKYNDKDSHSYFTKMGDDKYTVSFSAEWTDDVPFESLKKFLEQFYLLSNAEFSTLDGRETVRIDYTSFDGIKNGETDVNSVIWIMSNDKKTIYSLQLSTLSDDRIDNVAGNKLFNQILSTFKFSD